MVKSLSLAMAGLVSVIACGTFNDDDVATGLIETPSKEPLQSQGGRSVTQIYDINCAKCHGAQGQGGGGGTKSFNTLEMYSQSKDRPLFNAIKHGLPDAGMEAFGTALSDSEIWGLVVHIREMQHRALRNEGMGPKESQGIVTTKYHNYRREDVLAKDANLKVPWGMDWLPDGTMLVTNRGGRMTVARDGKVLGEVSGLPASVEIGQGGLMEVQVHPNYAKNGWIYLSFTDPAKSGGRSGFTKFVRGKLSTSGGYKWHSQETILEFDASNYNGSGVHFGSRIVFDGKGHVFLCIGERGNGNLAQDLTKPNGKIYRVNEDGSIPTDNPFADAASKAKGINPAIWSYGHRNPQGLVMDGEGNLWDTEHAPRGGDELNLVKKGANYGWPVISYGINYNDMPASVPWNTGTQKFEMPVFRWLPSTGACGMDIARGKAFPAWKGDLLAGGLSGSNVDRIRVKEGKLVEREEIHFGHGRVRDVSVGPDGYIYLAINDPDKVIRLVPVK